MAVTLARQELKRIPKAGALSPTMLNKRTLLRVYDGLTFHIRLDGPQRCK